MTVVRDIKLLLQITQSNMISFNYYIHVAVIFYN